MLILIVASGPDKGRVFELTDGKAITLGREAEDVRLRDRKVSRQHARLTCEGGAWTLEDLGSRHGTYRNRQKIKTSVPVRDGDVLQLGKSVLVASRLQVEQAERLALLGAVPTAAEALAATQPAGLRWGRITAAAAAVAIAALVGGNVYQVQQTRQQTDALARKLDASAQKDSQLLAAIDAIDAPNDFEPMLREVIAFARAQQDQQQMLADLQAAIAALPEAQQAALDGILARLEAREADTTRLTRLLDQFEAQQRPAPDAEALAAATEAQQTVADRLAAVLDAIEQRPTTQQLAAQLQADEAALAGAMPDAEALTAELVALRQTIAALPVDAGQPDQATASFDPAALTGRLDAMLAELQQRPTLDQVDARLAAVARSGAQTAASVEQLKRALPDTDRLQREVAAIRATLAAQPSRLEELLDQSLAKAPQPALDLNRLQADIATIKSALPGDLAQRLDRVVAQLDDMPSTATLAAAVTAAMQQPGATAPALADLRDAIRERPTGEQVAAELRAVLAAQPDKVGPALAELSRRLDAQPTAAQLADAVRDAVAAQGATLAALDAKLDALGEQADASRVLAALQDATQQQDAALIGKLDALVARLDDLADTGPAAADADRDALAQAHDQTAALLTEVLAAVRQTRPIDALREQVQALAQAVGESDQTLASVAASMQQRQDVDRKLADLHDRLATWPHSTGEQLDQILAKLDAQDTAETGALREVLAAVRQQGNGAAAPSRVTSDSYASASTARQIVQQIRPEASAADAAAGDDSLTPTEEAYRTAFVTDQPVTLGGGVDPTTREVLPGRTLDPELAKTAGIQTWREWYLIDGFAERMRLRKMAEEARRARMTDENIYRVQRVQ